GHLVRRGALLLDRGGDNARDVIDLVDHSADAPDCLYRALCVFLNSCDFLADIFGSFGGLVGEFLDLIRYDRKTFTRLSSPGGFDGCVECQKMRLLRDGRDDLNDLPISALDSPNLPTVALLAPAVFTASPATRAASLAFFEISLMVELISSAPVATV